MDIEILKTLGGVAGIGGIAIGMILLVYREIIRKNVFPRLSQRDAYRLLRHIAFLSWSIAVLGVAGWTWSQSLLHPGTTSGTAAASEASPAPKQNLVVAGTVVDQATNDAVGQATIAVDVDGLSVTSEDSGNFQLVLTGEHRGRIRITATKPGYARIEQSVEPPVHDLILQMARSK
jgi:hypothetical protein